MRGYRAACSSRAIRSFVTIIARTARRSLCRTGGKRGLVDKITEAVAELIWVESKRIGVAVSWTNLSLNSFKLLDSGAHSLGGLVEKE